MSHVARPNTLVLQCPAEVSTMSEYDFMVELFKSVPQSAVRACQFLPKNYLRVTFKDEASRDAVLVKGISVRGYQLKVFEADPAATLVYCYWVPVEVSTESIRHVLSAYGQVLDCHRQLHPEFPGIESGVRLVRVKLVSQIPDVIKILNFPCKIFYRGQPRSCRSCRKPGHLAKDCPLKGKCFRCGSTDHLARNCTNAWNTSPDPPSTSPDLPSSNPPVPATSTLVSADPSPSATPVASVCPAVLTAPDPPSSESTDVQPVLDPLSSESLPDPVVTPLLFDSAPPVLSFDPAAPVEPEAIPVDVYRPIVLKSLPKPVVKTVKERCSSHALVAFNCDVFEIFDFDHMTKPILQDDTSSLEMFRLRFYTDNPVHDSLALKTVFIPGMSPPPVTLLSPDVVPFGFPGPPPSNVSF